jgi:hypothetical protein
MWRSFSSFCRRHSWLTGLAVCAAVLLAGYWITQTWREYLGNRRLQSAQANAAADLPDWQWGPFFENGGIASEKENLAHDITAWMLQRSLTEFAPRGTGPKWLQEFFQWESWLYSGGREQIDWEMHRHPESQLPEKTSKSLEGIFGRAEAKADLQILRGWVDRPGGRYEYRPQGLSMMLLLPMVQKIREVANILGWDASWRAQRGESDLALQDLRALAMLARSFGEDPIPIGQLVRMAVGSHGLRKLERVLAQAERVNAGQLAALQAEYLAEAERPILLALARGSRAAEDRDMALLQDRTDLRDQWLNSWFFMSAAPRTPLSWFNPALEKVWKKLFIFPSWASWPSERAETLEYHNQFIELAKQPEAAWLRGCEVFSREIEHSGFLHKHVEGSWNGTSGSGVYEKVTKSLLRYRSYLRCGAAACAIERFRLEQGRWPSGWEELLPRYLSSVPLDAFTQKPLLWKALPDGLVIYSVDRNEKDDGGDVLESERGSPKDVGMRLWSPAARRQAAPSGEGPGEAPGGEGPGNE